MTARRRRGLLNGQRGELDLVRVYPIESIVPSPENNAVYSTIAWDDPEIVELARSIKVYGVQEPLLISRDGFIISGHRRRVAALKAGLKEVPVRVHSSIAQ
jgi:ParB-like chromosome segregation protein Spo0J